MDYLTAYQSCFSTDLQEQWTARVAFGYSPLFGCLLLTSPLADVTTGPSRKGHSLGGGRVFCLLRYSTVLLRYTLLLSSIIQASAWSLNSVEASARVPTRILSHPQPHRSHVRAYLGASMMLGRAASHTTEGSAATSGSTLHDGGIGPALRPSAARLLDQVPRPASCD